MICNSCGRAMEAHYKFCLNCGASAPQAQAQAPQPWQQPQLPQAPQPWQQPQQPGGYPAAAQAKPPQPQALPGGWQPLPGAAQTVTVAMSVSCDHCNQPVPLNGPTNLAHCDNCMKDTPLRRQHEELCLAAEGMQRLGSPYNTRIFGTPGAQCSNCDKDVPIDQYLAHHGVTTTIPCPSCGAGLPTFPVPAWLKSELPMAYQVFGGDVQTANEQGGMSLALDDKPQPIVMACPSCGGGLTIGAEAERTTACQFCQANVFLPDELWKRLHPVRTMEKWSVSYVGKLMSQEDLREAQEERAAEAQRKAERQQRRSSVEQQTQQVQKKANVGAFMGLGIGLLGAIAAVAFSFTGGSCSSAQGSFTAKGKPLTSFKMKVNGCRSGQRKNFFGVILLSEKSNQAIKVMEDPIKGMLVSVQVPSSCKGNTCNHVTFGKSACSKFDVEVRRTNTTVNDVRLLDGHLKISCKFDEGGTAKAKINFENCD